MVHTLPPWTTKYRMLQVFGSTDVNESAARLKSVDTYDRRGNVVLIDDFEGVALNWGEIKDLGTNWAHLVATKSHNGSQCVELDPGNTLSKHAGIEKKLIIPQISKLGFEISFNKFAAGQYFDLFLTIYTGADKTESGIRLYFSTDKFQYYNNGQGWTDITTSFKITKTTEIWNTLKLVVDLDALTYTRCLLNHTTLDVEDIAFYSITDGTSPCSHVQYKAYSNGMLTDTIFLDDFIYTQNEP